MQEKGPERGASCRASLGGDLQISQILGEEALVAVSWPGLPPTPAPLTVPSPLRDIGDSAAGDTEPGWCQSPESPLTIFSSR